MISRNAMSLSLITLLLCSSIAVAQSASPAQKSSRDSKSKDSETSAFDDVVAKGVLEQIRDGLQGHSQSLMLSSFDREKFEGYRAFEDQVQAYFERHEGFRAYFRIIQTSVEGNKGVVLAEFDVEGLPSGGGAAMRRSKQLRFEMESGRKGWKVVDMRPRDFFW